MTRLHLQLALDLGTLDQSVHLVQMALPYVNSIEIGTPLLIREGIVALEAIHPHLDGTEVALFVDSKISDEGIAIARLCFDAGADAISVVDGASTNTLRAVRAVADEMGKQVWVDLMYHSNPILRARTLSPYADGFVVHRPQTGFPPLLIEGLLIIDRPIRIAGGLTLEIARREIAARQSSAITVHEGIVVGRAITQSDNVEAALQAFAELCRGGERT
jgi:3-keto-L-gulonate-6-phosphate decarboxylase